MLKYSEYFLIFVNILIIFYFNKKKIKKIFYNPKITSVDLEKVDDCFLPDIIDHKLKSPNDTMVIKTFFVPHSWNVIGMTSDYEAWILSVLSKKSSNIFEFGTCSGKTTYLFSLNSGPAAKIYTITLPPEDVNQIKKDEIGDNFVAHRNAMEESKYDQFMFSNKKAIQEKIKVIFQDSKTLNIEEFKNSFDLIFIDGGHTYSCIKNDTEKAMQMLKKKGFILWHDYSIGKRSHKDVYKYLNEIREMYEIYHIKNTSFCFYKKN